MGTYQRGALGLTIRYHRAYPYPNMALVDEAWEFPVAKTGFVALHLWNVGTPGGPLYPDEFAVGMSNMRDHTDEVIDNHIKPCLDAARQAGLTIFHVEPDLIANKYPVSNLEWRATDIPPYPEKWGNLPPDEDAEGPQAVAPAGDLEASWTDAIPGWSQRRAELVHGPGYRSWQGYQQMDMVESCKPMDGDYVIKTTPQFDRICRKVGVVNLIYTGFSTQGCVLFAPGAMSDMSARGYRVMLVREATLGVEYADTVEDRLATRLAIRMVEHKFGFSIGAMDFIRACREASAAPHVLLSSQPRT